MSTVGKRDYPELVGSRFCAVDGCDAQDPPDSVKEQGYVFGYHIGHEICSDCGFLFCDSHLDTCEVCNEWFCSDYPDQCNVPAVEKNQHGVTITTGYCKEHRGQHEKIKSQSYTNG